MSSTNSALTKLRPTKLRVEDILKEEATKIVTPATAIRTSGSVKPPLVFSAIKFLRIELEIFFFDIGDKLISHS